MTTRCPSCFGQSKVLDSRESGSTRKRYRRCEHCGERWTTVETMADEASLQPDDAYVRDARRLLAEYGALNRRWRNLVRETIRNCLARQEVDATNEEDAA